MNLIMFIGSFVNGNVSTFRVRILVFLVCSCSRTSVCLAPTVSQYLLSDCGGGELLMLADCLLKEEETEACPWQKPYEQRGLWDVLPLSLLCEVSIAFHDILCVGGVWAHSHHSPQTSWGMDTYLRARPGRELIPWQPETERCAEKHLYPVANPDLGPHLAFLKAPSLLLNGKRILLKCRVLGSSVWMHTLWALRGWEIAFPVTSQWYWCCCLSGPA